MVLNLNLFLNTVIEIFLIEYLLFSECILRTTGGLI